VALSAGGAAAAPGGAGAAFSAGAATAEPGEAGALPQAVISASPSTRIPPCSGLVNLLHSSKRLCDYGVLTPSGQERPLEPRYRRVLGIGDVLDESIQLFRRHWLSFTVISAIGLLPPGLVTIWFATVNPVRQISSADLQSGRISPQLFLQLMGEVGLIFLIAWVFYLFWSGAVLAAADDYLRGGEAPLSHVYGIALRRFLQMLLVSIFITVGAIMSMVASSLLFAVTVFGTVGSLIALIGLVVWWLNPNARKTWLKWLIILTAPFGLTVYLVGCWSRSIAAIVVERRNAWKALFRSAELVDRNWLRVAAILFMAGIIVGVIEYGPQSLVQIPLTLAGAGNGQIGFGAVGLALLQAVGVVMQILFASIGTIVYAMLFVDLRNRREGADLAERLSQLEDASAWSNV
jgi:hypothetical protein